jgi:hypothetical protein
MCMLSERWFNTWCMRRNGPHGGWRCHAIRWHPTSPCRNAFSWWQYYDLLRFHNTALRCRWRPGCQPLAPNNCITVRFCLDRSVLGTPIFNRHTSLPFAVMTLLCCLSRVRTVPCTQPHHQMRLAVCPSSVAIRYHLNNRRISYSIFAFNNNNNIYWDENRFLPGQLHVFNDVSLFLAVFSSICNSAQIVSNIAARDETRWLILIFKFSSWKKETRLIIAHCELKCTDISVMTEFHFGQSTDLRWPQYNGIFLVSQLLFIL